MTQQVNADPRSVPVTDDVAVLGSLHRRLERSERNSNDPLAWIYVGSGAPAPDFMNGFYNVGPPRVLLRYRFLRPYDPSSGQNAVQIQGSVTGGSPGLPIFRLAYPQWFPDGTADWQTFLLDYDVHLTACDDSGNLVVITVQGSTGYVIHGFV
jgi:hypothetical protein